MKKILLVMRQELRKTLRSTAYVIFAFVLPVVAVLVLAVINLVRGASSASETVSTTPEESKPAQIQIQIEGYVDQSGLISTIPASIPPGHLISYPDEEAAKAALESGTISAYYVIPREYLEEGKIYYVYPDDRSYLDDGQQWVISMVLLSNLMGGDAELADRVWNPAWNVQVEQISSGVPEGAPVGEDCTRPGSACESNELVRMIPLIVLLVLYLAFLSSSSMLFNSVGTERENRIIEVLMSSISPRQLLGGKILGLCAAGLLQTSTWMIAIYLSLSIGGTTLSLPENFSFPPGLIFWSIVFFLGGYGLYASLMAGAGALVPKMKEAGIAQYIALIPLIVGYLVALVAPLSGTANDLLMVVLSIFPFTAPVVMIVRLSDGFVPLWQAVLSAILTYLTAWWAVNTGAKMFRAQNLLSGQSFSLKRYFAAIIGRS